MCLDGKVSGVQASCGGNASLVSTIQANDAFCRIVSASYAFLLRLPSEALPMTLGPNSGKAAIFKESCELVLVWERRSIVVWQNCAGSLACVAGRTGSKAVASLVTVGAASRQELALRCVPCVKRSALLLSGVLSSPHYWRIG